MFDVAPARSSSFMETVLLPTRDPEDANAPRWLHRRRRRDGGDSRRRMSRRHFLQRAARALAGVSLAGGAYGFGEAKWCRVHVEDVPVRRLPGAFEGLKVAFFADTHYGPGVPLAYLRGVVSLVNGLGAEVILLGGDYVQRYWQWLAPDASDIVRRGLGVFSELRAPRGVFAVLGNHDNFSGQRGEILGALAAAGVRTLENTGVWLERGGARLRVCGVGDISTGSPDPATALGDAGAGETAVVLTHNPDLVEEMFDPRIGLVLCGHTHGGQVVIPGLDWAPVVPSRFDQKYLHGLRRAPSGAPVFITRGVGTILPPVRVNCPPEVALLTLRGEG